MHYITAYYKFTPIDNIETTKNFFDQIAESTNTKGLVILATEGFNSTVSNLSLSALNEFKQAVLNHFNLENLNFKDSESDALPFRGFVIKIRPEIVTTGNTSLLLESEKNHHLSPDEWNKVIETENPILIDTRNWYEHKIGTFKGAINPNTDKFSEFTDFMDLAKIEKNQKVLIFCTGGIRCEKGILELQEKGYSEVYQLEGGILNYLEQKPHEQFEGECFVFDQRVALDQSLAPTKQYILCPHCGQPGKTQIDCKKCDTTSIICDDCALIEWKKDTCSKNCAHHYELNPNKKAPKQLRFNR